MGKLSVIATTRSLINTFMVASLIFLGWTLLDLASPVQIGDTLYHIRYGWYLAVVPFHQGMTLYPGQSATVNIPVATKELI